MGASSIFCPLTLIPFLSSPTPFRAFALSPYATALPISVSRRDRPPDACKIDRVPSERWEGNPPARPPARGPGTRATHSRRPSICGQVTRRTAFAMSKQRHASRGHHASPTPSRHQASATQSKLRRKIDLTPRTKLDVEEGFLLKNPVY